MIIGSSKGKRRPSCIADAHRRYHGEFHLLHRHKNERVCLSNYSPVRMQAHCRQLHAEQHSSCAGTNAYLNNVNNTSTGHARLSPLCIPVPLIQPSIVAPSQTGFLALTLLHSLSRSQATSQIPQSISTRSRRRHALRRSEVGGTGRASRPHSS